jgi:FkbM family methyltransferase
MPVTPAVEPQPLWVTLSASALRALPFGRYRAASALARFARGPFLARLPADLGGASFACDLGDSIAREVCFTGRYEPQETQIARRLLGPSMRVVDVGANWGYFTLVAASLVGPGGRVLALEPHPRLHALLRENVLRNAIAQVTCLELAASDVAGRTGVVAAPIDAGNSGLSRLASCGERADFECAMEPLDAVIARHALDVVDLVKIDVEGAEPRVLRGMADGLRRRRYRFVLLECHPQALEIAGTSIEACVAVLEESGYRGWHIDHSPDMHRRTARTVVPLSDLLTPWQHGRVGADWPHLLWAAPGERLPG